MAIKFRIKNVHIIHIIFSLCINNPVNAKELQKNYRSAAYLGKGDAATAITQGADAVFYNPAGIGKPDTILSELVLVSPQGEASSNINDLKNKNSNEYISVFLANENKPYFVAVQNNTGIIFKNFGLGAIERASGTVYYGKNAKDNVKYLNITARTWNGGYLSFAKNFFDNHLSFGFTGKFLEKKEVDLSLTESEILAIPSSKSFKEYVEEKEKRGNALGADLGIILLLHKETNTKFGVAVQNIGMNYNWNTSKEINGPSADPHISNAGFTTSFGTRKNQIKIFAEYKDILNSQEIPTLMHTHAGIEYTLLNVLNVSMGSNQGYLSSGIGLNFKIIRLEGGTYAEEIGDKYQKIKSPRYFARASLGWLL